MAWVPGRTKTCKTPWAWGDNPVYHMPVFVLTHHAREPMIMEGGTTFYFVTEGPMVIQQYLRLGLVDERHTAILPVVLGSGERLLDGVNLPGPGLRLHAAPSLGAGDACGVL